ncbi:catabolite repressor/activator [Pasteurellaceae bacterium 20609_3]|uniref:catabolite repressor/activator n=1 Tax=Spirabiliibacterium mucosae TaxID=28156 RepID=UPI001AADE64F|nr:catabolite repressor/activator [Spirabiliibacterium mucosae]MBE2898940.1 catabolite repressor/activator [Spirabiliibacterium mucosae]
MKLDEIAKLAGVSRTTASYVVNGKAKQYRVSDRTIEKVMAVVKAHNFKPNAVAAGLRAGRTNTIGLIVPDLENTSYAKIATRFERACRENNLQLFISCSGDESEQEKLCAKQLITRQIDALVVATALLPEDAFYHQFDLPIIGFDREIRAKQAHNVLYDDSQDSAKLARALWQAHRPKRVLFLGAKPELGVSQARERGFMQAFSDYQNQSAVERLYANEFTREAAERTFHQWLAKNTLPDAVFATSQTLLQGVFQTLLASHGQLPQQLIIATFGDPTLLELLPNRVISAVQPYSELADHLMSACLQKINKKATTALEILAREIG